MIKLLSFAILLDQPSTEDMCLRNQLETERELGCFRLNEQDGQLFPLEEKERALGNVIDSSK